jgi:ribokinase
VPRLPAAGETVLGADVVTRPGGKGANQAVAAHRMGAHTILVAAVGDDQFGATVRSELAAAGLGDDRLTTLDAPTGVALVIVEPGGANVITVASGANARLAPAHLDGLDLDAQTVLLLQLETPVGTALAAARRAGAGGARVVLNAAPITDSAAPELTELLRCTDVLVVNESEALALQPQPQPATVGEWESIAIALRGLGPDVVVVTLGEAGAVYADSSGPNTVPAHPVEAVDTTGAGDAFCGTLAATLAAGSPLAAAVGMAGRAGALATTAVGAQSALPTAADLARIGAVEAGG